MKTVSSFRVYIAGVFVVAFAFTGFSFVFIPFGRIVRERTGIAVLVCEDEFLTTSGALRAESPAKAKYQAD